MTLPNRQFRSAYQWLNRLWRNPTRERPRARTIFCPEWMEDRMLLSTFVVSNTANSGPGSLRQAILGSNAAVEGANTIDFAIPGRGLRTINLTSPLPAITSALSIDGESQRGYVGTPLIALDGAGTGHAATLVVSSTNVDIRGLQIDGVVIAFTNGSFVLSQLQLAGPASHLAFSGPPSAIDVGRAGVAVVQPYPSGHYVLSAGADHVVGNYILTLSWVGTGPAASYSIDKGSGSGLVGSTGPGGGGLPIHQLGQLTGAATDLIAVNIGTGVQEPDADADGTTTSAPATLGSALLASFAPGQTTGLGQSGYTYDASEPVRTDGEPAETTPKVSLTRLDAGTSEARFGAWALFAAGLDDARNDLRTRMTNEERTLALAVPDADDNASGKASRSPGAPIETPANLNPQVGLSTPGAKLEPAPGEGATSHRAATSPDRAGPRLDRAGDSRSGRRATATDAALEDLDPSMSRACVAALTSQTPVVDRSEPQTSSLAAIAAASVTLSMTLERGIRLSRQTRAARVRVTEANNAPPNP